MLYALCFMHYAFCSDSFFYPSSFLLFLLLTSEGIAGGGEEGGNRRFMNEYIVSVGSNINPQSNINKARVLIKKHFSFIKESEFIQTKPCDYKHQGDFLNGAFLVKSNLNKKDFKDKLLEIEKELKRVRSANKNGPRTIDLDITVINDDICDDDYHKYWFVKKTVDQVRVI